MDSRPSARVPEYPPSHPATSPRPYTHARLTTAARGIIGTVAARVYIYRYGIPVYTCNLTSNYHHPWEYLETAIISSAVLPPVRYIVSPGPWPALYSRRVGTLPSTQCPVPTPYRYWYLDVCIGRSSYESPCRSSFPLPASRSIIVRK